MNFFGILCGKTFMVPKIFVDIATFTSFFWAIDAFFYGWSEICRYISLIYYFLDFAHYAH